MGSGCARTPIFPTTWAANRATTSSNQISKRHCRLTHSLYSLYSLPSLHSRTHCTHALTVLTALTVLKHSRTHCTHCTQLKLKCQPAAVLQMARVINSDPSSETLSSTNQRNQSDSCRGSNLAEEYCYRQVNIKGALWHNYDANT